MKQMNYDIWKELYYWFYMRLIHFQSLNDYVQQLLIHYPYDQNRLSHSIVFYWGRLLKSFIVFVSRIKIFVAFQQAWSTVGL